MSIFNKQKKIGIVGLGIIGKGIAEHLRKNKYQVYVWNRSPLVDQELFMGSLSELANNVDVIQLFLTDGKAVKDVINELLPNINKKHTIINHSTISIDDTLFIGELLQKHEVKFIDAPFTGSKLAAQDGKLVYYVGAEHSDFDNIKEYLESSSSEIKYFGKLGNGTIIKLATNIIAGVTVGAIAESLKFLRLYGLNEDTLLEAIEGNVIYSKIVEMKLGKVLNNDMEPHFSLKNLQKDMDIAIQNAKNEQKDLPITRSLLKSIKSVIAQNEKNANFDFAVLADKSV